MFGFGPTTIIIGCIGVLLIGFLILATRFYRKVAQGQAFVRTGGPGGTRVSFAGMFSFPVIHYLETMDISVKRIEIYRHGTEGLICRDNMRADIKVSFFVRVNKQIPDVLRVAEQLGCVRASQESALIELFDAKFSEALKTVGKQFDFVELYVEREKFRDEILAQIGEDLNGYKLENAHIDYLEQTPKVSLNPDNILDAEGIKKITDLTAHEIVLANGIERDKEKTIRKQDVEAREAILELDRQLAEAEERQAKEVAAVTARERSEAQVVQQQEKLKAEHARIATEEQVQVAEENKQRQIIVALKSKDRTDKVETERVERDRELENVERNRVVSIADIEKDKAVEVEKKLIQDVIRERVMVERKVVEEQERIKDTEQFAGADRSKRVQITKAEEDAQRALIKEVKAAEAQKTAAERRAEQIVIEAEAGRAAAEKQTQAKKMLAEATAAEAAATGLGEAKVIEVTAAANQKQGEAEANVARMKYEAEATGIDRTGTAEASVLKLKYDAEADGITAKAEAMKLFDSVGKEHEEFKLRLQKDLDVELAAINIQKAIAAEQSAIVGEALKQARIDIVGGDSDFFDRIVNSVTGGKVVDRYVNNSHVLSDIKQTFFNGDPEYFQTKLEEFFDLFQMETADVRNVSIAALIGKMMTKADTPETRSELELLLEMAERTGVASKKAGSLKLGRKGKA
jgi:uncharacterized membrane protein YqiK